MSADLLSKTWAAMSPGERFDAVTVLIGRGCTSSSIAGRLSTTRNTICGFCHRRGITLTGKSAGHVNLSRPKNERSAAGGHATRKKAGVTLANHAARPSVGGSADVSAAIAVVVAPADAPDPVASPAGGVGFMALTDQHCKRPLWPNGAPPPLSGMFFCGGRAVAGSSYCRACTPRLTAPTSGLIRQRNRTYGDTRAFGAGPLPSSPTRGEGAPAARPVNPAAGAAS